MSLKTKWFCSWAALAALTVSLGVFVNFKKYPDRGLSFWLWKGAADAGLSWLLSWKLPALLVGYISFWASDLFTKDAVEKLAVGIITGIVVGSVSGWFKEVELLLGVCAMDQVTSRFLYHWNRLGVESREYAIA